jgi:hypothetical protein
MSVCDIVTGVFHAKRKHDLALDFDKLESSLHT